jgi:hypothetical protein
LHVIVRFVDEDLKQKSHFDKYFNILRTKCFIQQCISKTFSYTTQSIYIYKEECLFFMHLIPVTASVTKISTGYSQDLRKIKAKSPRPGRIG